MDVHGCSGAVIEQVREGPWQQEAQDAGNNKGTVTQPQNKEKMREKSKGGIMNLCDGHVGSQEEDEGPQRSMRVKAKGEGDRGTVRRTDHMCLQHAKGFREHCVM